MTDNDRKPAQRAVMELKTRIWMNGSLEWFAYLGDEEVYLGGREVPYPPRGGGGPPPPRETLAPPPGRTPTPSPPSQPCFLLSSPPPPPRVRLLLSPPLPSPSFCRSS
ncbi:hypothetical protein EG829_07500, partial [bacterium]|nr:hypothetical protein [bacterium]